MFDRPLMKKSAARPTALFVTCALLLIACSQTNTPQTSTTASPATSPSPGALPEGSPGGGSSNTISIGIGVAQTSNVALLGQEQMAGAKIAQKYFNDQGGVDGTPIKLVFQDTGGDEQGTINAFNTLINQDKVVGIVGPTLSQQAFSADPIADRAKVPVLAPSNTAKGIPQIGDYVARVSAPVAVVAPNAVKAMGLEFATVQKFLTTDTDFQSQATNAINVNPDLIIISGLAADGGNLIKQLRELGYKGVIIGGNGLNTSNVFAVCKALCDGVLIAQAYSPEYENEVNKAFRDAYRAQFKKEPPQFSAQAFTGVQVFVESLKAINAKSKISEKPLAELRTNLNQQLLGGKYNTPLGEISFTPEGEINQKDFYVARIKMEADGNNGKFEFLK